MKAFVEFGHETSYTKSPFHTELETRLKTSCYGACFHLIGLVCCETLTIKQKSVPKYAV